MCLHFGIIPIQATMPSISSPYYAGFFDADGTLGVYINGKGCPYLQISVYNKYRVDLEPYLTTFGGKIYEGKGTPRWSAANRDEVLAFLKYYKSINHFKSFKSTKFLLIEEYYELKELRAYRPSSIHNPRWKIHHAKWDRKGYDD